MKVCIISGASSGIGKAIAHELDTFGFDELWLIGRNECRLKETKGNLKSNARIFTIDLCSTDAYSVLENELSNGKYEVGALVLSAGVGYTGTLEENTHSKITNMIDTNCKSLTLLINTVMHYIPRGGKIITLASGAGFLPQADFAVYAATKSYVISLSRALCKELKPKGITVCTVCPGPVDTDFFAGLENVKEHKRKYLISPQRVAKGAVKAAWKGKALYVPTVSMKLLHIASKLLPTSLLLKFSK